MTEFFKRGVRWVAKSLTNSILEYSNFSINLKVLKFCHIWHIFVDKSIDLQLELLSTLRKKKPIGSIRLTSTGVLLYLTNDVVYQISCGKHSQSALNKNFESYTYLKKSNYSCVVDYLLVQHGLQNIIYYRVERLFPVSDVRRSAKTLFETLEGNFTQDQFANLNLDSAYNFLKKYCELTDDELKKLRPVQEKGYVGPMHGDFHSQNIMQTKNGHPVLIDLDRFLMSGSQVIDRIHFNITQYESRQKYWVKLLIGLIGAKQKSKSNFSTNSYLAYFCFRVSAEISSQVKPQQVYINRLKFLSKRLVDKVSQLEKTDSKFKDE